MPSLARSNTNVLDSTKGLEMATHRARTIDGLQGLTALLGITLGVLPLIQALVGGHPGLLRLVLGEDAGSMTYAAPIAVVVVIAVVIAVLEGTKRRRPPRHCC